MTCLTTRPKSWAISPSLTPLVGVRRRPPL
jgi:hypothetical protein